MRWKNNLVYALGCAALLIASNANAKLRLNPFHKKSRDTETSTVAPDAAAPIVSNPAPSGPPDALAQYDEVTYASAGAGYGVSIGNARLPVPSFVELTNLNSGKTILAVVSASIAPGRELATLSPQAMALLGSDISQSLPVRVRRINPSEQEKAALLGGQKVGDRLDTPAILLTALRRKLAGTQGQSTGASTRQSVVYSAPNAIKPAKPVSVSHTPAPQPLLRRAPPTASPAALPQAAPVGGRFIVEEAGKPPRVLAARPANAHPTHNKTPITAATESPADEPVAPASPLRQTDGIYIQVASVSSAAHAEDAARKLGRGASVAQVGAHWHIIMGPYASEAQARAQFGALAAKGYRGVRVTR